MNPSHDNFHDQARFKSQFPHVVNLKYPLPIFHSSTPHSQGIHSRQSIIEWFKANGIYTAKSFGSNGQVLIDHKWQRLSFKQQEHAVLFALTWNDLIKIK